MLKNKFVYILLSLLATLLYIVIYKVSTIDILASRKILTIIAGITFYLIMIYVLFKYSISKFLFVLIILIPFWMRSSFYFGFDVLPNNFNYITLDIIIFLSTSILLTVYILNIKINIKIDKILLLILLVTFTYLIATSLNIYIRKDVSLLELDIVLINFLLPMIILLSFYFYLINSDDRIKKRYIKSIYYFYITIILFAIIELLIKGQHVLLNPSMFLQYGLRFPSLEGGSQIISGGLRDMLYFAFLEAIYPLLGIIFLQNKMISLKQYKIFLGISIFFVLAIYSKGPILVLLINLYFANKYIHFIKIKNIIKFSPFLIGILFFIVSSLAERLSKFNNVLVSLFIDDNHGAAMTEESSAAGRLIEMIERFQEFLLSPWVGYSSLDLVNNSFVFLLSAYGIIFTIIFTVITFLIYKQLNNLGKNILFSWFVFSMVDFGVIIEIGGTRNHLLQLSQDAYIQQYGWVPCYSTANIYVSILILVLILISCKKGVIKNENNTSISNKSL